MVDEIRSNLEPIEPTDLDLRKKLEDGPAAPAGVEGATEQVGEPGSIEIVQEKKEAVGEKENFYDKILSKVKGGSNNDDSDAQTIDDDAEIVNKEKEVESKIQALISIAESKGVIYAVKVAKKIEDNYILDELHDRMLSEELHKALVAKGFLKEI